MMACNAVRGELEAYASPINIRAFLDSNLHLCTKRIDKLIDDGLNLTGFQNPPVIPQITS
jgi:hypothetical protein